MKENICLIGFMGSGKTTIGNALSKELNCKWVDLDAVIVQGEQKTIPELFEAYGEAYFRALETKYLNKVLKQPHTIISTGGGVIVTNENVQMLKKQKTFYLHWKFDTLYERITGDANRPLVTSYEEVLNRFKAREALYEAASYKVINCEGKTINEIVKCILKDGKDSLNEK